MKRFVATIALTIFLAACSWFGKPEAYKSEGNRTTFKSAEASPSESVAPAPHKIPGASR